MSTSDSSAEVTVIIDGLVSDSTNPVLPAALFFFKKNFFVKVNKPLFSSRSPYQSTLKTFNLVTEFPSKRL